MIRETKCLRCGKPATFACGMGECKGMTKKEKAANKRYSLRDCPFCGSAVYLDQGLRGEWAIYYLDCNKYSKDAWSSAKAAKAWNGVK